jgi:hypothetical protein
MPLSFNHLFFKYPNAHLIIDKDFNSDFNFNQIDEEIIVGSYLQNCDEII